MKLKRMITIVTALCVTLCLAGCSLRVTVKVPADANEADTPDVPAINESVSEDAGGEAEEKSVASPYDAVTAQYAEAIARGATAAEMTEAGLNYMIPDCVEYDERAHVGWFTEDITGNGTDELIIAAASESEYYTGMVFAVYTLEDGAAKLMLQSGERDRWYWAGGQRLLNIGSDGASRSGTYLCDAANDMGYVEAVEYNADEFPDEPWLIFGGETWSHADDETAAAKELELKMTVINPPITEF